MSVRRFIDHTGEVWGNREITGRGEWKRYGKGHGFWTWRWKCLDCGATGTANQYLEIKRHSHTCPGKKTSQGRPPLSLTDMVERYVPPTRVTDKSKLCAKQCRSCGHYSPDVHGCCYILDTGHVRPKVDLRTENCPVRDTKFKRQTPAMKVGVVIGEGWDKHDT